MKYLNHYLIVSDKIFEQVIETFEVYDYLTQFIYSFIHLSDSITDENDIKITDINKIKTINQLQELIKEVLKKDTKVQLSNLFNRIDNFSPDDENLKDVLNELIFTNFRNCWKFIHEFIQYIIHSQILTKGLPFKYTDNIKIKFKSLF